MISCKHPSIKTNMIVGDEGDIEQTICSNEDCGFIIKEEAVVERADGTKIKRPRRVSLEDQPDGFQFTDKEGTLKTPEERLPSAQDMMLLAIKTREDTVGKEGKVLAKGILDKCAENVLLGEYQYKISSEEEISGEIISLAVKELKGQGYQVKRIPEPGVGTWIQVKWPTKTKKPRKKKNKEGTPETDIQVITKKNKRQRPGPSSKDMEVRQKQAAAAKHREKALKARSD